MIMKIMPISKDSERWDRKLAKELKNKPVKDRTKKKDKKNKKK